MEELSKTSMTEGIVTSNHKKRLTLSGASLKVALAVVLVGLFAAGVWWLISTGRLDNVSSKSPVIACGNDVVTKYNAAMFYRTRDGSTTPSLDKAGLKKLAVEIKTKANYATDPTCQTILFWAAVQGDNYKDANDAYKAVKSLHDEGKFADSNLQSNEPVFTYQQYMNSLSGSGVKEVKESIGG